MLPAVALRALALLDRSIVGVEHVGQIAIVDTVTHGILRLLALFAVEVRRTEALVADLGGLGNVGGMVVVRRLRLTCAAVQARVLSLTDVEEDGEWLVKVARLLEHVDASEHGSDADGRPIAVADSS